MSKQIDNKQLQTLEPKALWEQFRQLTLIPRPSRHEGAALDHIAEVGRSLGHEVIRDGGNVIIRAKATPGLENLTPVILQGHADMVPQKDPEVQHDFTTDPIETKITDGKVTACGTTLGADDGIGVAAALAVLADPTVAHGPLEILVTREEETSMGGAAALEPDVLQGLMLLNLDTESWGEICIGCASGIDVTATFHGNRVETADTDVAIKVTLSGLRGGHSGMDINLGRANANKLMARFLKFAAANYESMLADIDGGNMRNAIPRSATAILTIDEEDLDDFMEAVDEFEDMFRSEFSSTEPLLSFSAEKVELPATVLDEMTTDDLINALQGAPNGPLKMNADLPGLVETSSNMAIVKSEGDMITVKFLVRSSMESEREDVTSSLDSIFRLAGADVETSGEYPGWKPDVNSKALAVVKSSYERLFGAEPDVTAVHAGLECGIMGETYPNWDMVSFGPTISHPHSPAESVDIESVGHFWKLLLDVLKNIPPLAK